LIQLIIRPKCEWSSSIGFATIVQRYLVISYPFMVREIAAARRRISRVCWGKSESFWVTGPTGNRVADPRDCQPPGYRRDKSLTKGSNRKEVDF